MQENEIRNVIKAAEKVGSFQFDTAPAYGNAEVSLGKYLKNPSGASVFTKISGEELNSVSQMMDSARRSLERTRVSKFSGIYLHNEDIFDSVGLKEIRQGVKELLDSGITEKVGISVYSLDTLLKAKDICPELNLFQIPENICDRRTYNSEKIQHLSLNGNSIYIRSVFLQGLLLMEPKDIPNRFNKVIPCIEKLIEYSKSLNISREVVCLSYALMIPWAEGIVVGVASLSQLENLLNPTITLPNDFEGHIPTVDSEILDPRNWPNLK
jgi:hypothetical protein